MCTTTTHYATHISTECSIGGSAQCDGVCVDHGDACSCSCHNAWDLPFTTADVRDWHDVRNGVVASFENHKHGTGPTGAEYLAILEANRRNDKPVDGTLYAATTGQDRAIVVLQS